ncbi:MAG: response regulator [Azospirillum sp.]|nr:response regulator [Azospirillum sp.]
MASRSRPSRVSTARGRGPPSKPGSAAGAAEGGDVRAADFPAVDFPVVGLGASAGGLDAFRRFFEAVPADSGMAYVLIQHLDPTHESMMVELLAARTPMTVRQAADGMPVERSHVYVIAPGTYLAIEGGALRLSEPRERHGARLPFDFFLHSLAEACGKRAVCVILSGTGGDGSLGLRAVRQKGGLVIAQEPQEAAFDGMPLSAIATGCVNAVLPVAKIPEAILQQGKRNHLMSNQDSRGKGERPDAATAQLSEIIGVLRSRTGYDFSHYKEGTLLRRIKRRLAATGIADRAAYLDTLRQGSGESELLARDLLINVTSFFRDPEAFEVLAATVVADLVARQPLDRPLRIWVPGCSTGEEAYSLAILFLEAIAAAGRPVKLQIFASDVDPDAVAVARGGLYPDSIVADVPPARRARWFTREPAGLRAMPELCRAVVFTVQDVLTDPPFSRLDLISCRNLLIYLRPDIQRKVLLLFHFELREGGILFLGSAETVGDLDHRFEPISKPQRIYRHIGRSGPGEIDFPIGTGGGTDVSLARLLPRPEPKSPGGGEVMRALLLEACAPASVLINRKHETLYTLGRIDRYLRVAPGAPSRDLFAMVREGLRTKLRAAIQRANQDQKRVVVTGAEFDHDGTAATVTIDVQPVRSNGEALLAVSFIDAAKPEPQPSAAAAAADNDPSAAFAAGDSAQVALLERELDATRTELRSAIRSLEIANEEQKAINEEAMSVNEEFQSTNEELETSKEELQSLNEELTALNGQLQETVERHRSTADDLQNILNSSDVATLFLDRQLNIRFFTSGANSLFGTIATDIGRPLADLARRFDDPDLLSDAQAVLTMLVPKKREVRTDTGAWHQRRALPYRSHDGRIEGVVITFGDISELKAVEQEFQAARAYAESVIDTVRQPLLVLDRSLRLVSANPAFFRLCGLEPADTVGRDFATGDDPSGTLRRLRDFLALIGTAPAPIEDYEIEIDLPPQGHRHLLVNARSIPYRPSAEPLILLAVDDITERKQATSALEAAKRQAEHANVAKSRFLAAASHDLRQPLQTLNLLQGLLARTVTDPAAVALVTRLDETLGAMSGMLNTLLDINQLEAGIVRATISCFPITAILERLRNEFSYHTQARGLSWRVIGCAAVVRSDPHLLEQILRNLLSNAVKYTGHGRVLLGCRRRGEHLHIEVWDTGSGIPEAHQHAIFEEFTQLDNPARERSKGLGLGLAIVRRLADMLNHTVEVCSVPDKGSMFSVAVPIAGAERPVKHLVHEQPPNPANAHAGKTILIVEDDPASRELLEVLLDGEGFRTWAVADGAAALALAAQDGVRPDLVVADYNLPGAVTGVQIVEHLRQIPGRPNAANPVPTNPIPAIILTGDISIATLQDIARQGCLHLAKPVRTAALLCLIHDLLSPPPAPAIPAASGPKSAPEPTGRLPASPSAIFVIDDDAVLRDTLRALLESDHGTVETYPSAEAFLDAWQPGRDGCLVVDARLPGLSGIELVERLAAEGHSLPTIVITGYGDIDMAVRAMKAGAADFIEKPVRADELLAGIDHAIALARDHTKREAAHKAAEALVAGLTARQRQIMDLVLAGSPSKNIAADLGISQRTVENHRAAIMKKTGSKSLPALARLAVGLA